MIGVYEIKIPNTKNSYVGSSIDIQKRVDEHFKRLRSGKHHCKKLQEIYDKKDDLLELFVLLKISKYEYEKEPKIIIREEQYFLDGLSGKRWNTSKSAFSPMHDPEVAARVSKTKMGHKVSEATRLKISKSKKGVKQTEQAKLNQSKGKMGHIVTEATRRKIRRAHKGHTRNQNPEVKRKISESQIKRLQENPDIILRHAQMMKDKNIKLTNKQKDHLSKSSKGYKHSPETLEKMRKIQQERGNKLKGKKLLKPRRKQLTKENDAYISSKFNHDKPSASYKLLCNKFGVPLNTIRKSLKRTGNY